MSFWRTLAFKRDKSAPTFKTSTLNYFMVLLAAVYFEVAMRIGGRQ